MDFHLCQHWLQAVKMLPADSLEEEEAYLEAQRHGGAHKAIRNPSMQIFWFRHLPKRDEPSFEVFWANFPKNFARLFSRKLEHHQGSPA